MATLGGETGTGSAMRGLRYVLGGMDYLMESDGRVVEVFGGREGKGERYHLDLVTIVRGEPDRKGRLEVEFQDRSGLTLFSHRFEAAEAPAAGEFLAFLESAQATRR